MVKLQGPEWVRSDGRCVCMGWVTDEGLVLWVVVTVAVVVWCVVCTRARMCVCASMYVSVHVSECARVCGGTVQKGFHIARSSSTHSHFQAAVELRATPGAHAKPDQ